MSHLEASLQSIRRVVKRVGMVEAARMSGVPYSTLAEAVRRDFRSRVTETLSKLSEFAEAYERDNGDEEQARDAAA